MVLLDTSFSPVRQGISYDTSQVFVPSIFIIFEKSYFMVTFSLVIWENYRVNAPFFSLASQRCGTFAPGDGLDLSPDPITCMGLDHADPCPQAHRAPEGTEEGERDTITERVSCAGSEPGTASPAPYSLRHGPSGSDGHGDVPGPWCYPALQLALLTHPGLLLSFEPWRPRTRPGSVYSLRPEPRACCTLSGLAPSLAPSSPGLHTSPHTRPRGSCLSPTPGFIQCGRSRTLGLARGFPRETSGSFPSDDGCRPQTVI